MALFCLGAAATASFAYLLESVLLGNRAPMIGASGVVFGVTVLGNAHFGKSTDRKAIHRTLGSLALLPAWTKLVLPSGEEEAEPAAVNGR